MKLFRKLFNRKTPKYTIRTFDDFWNSIDMKTINHVSVKGEVFLRVVNCKDCAYYTGTYNGNYCKMNNDKWSPDDYCSKGKAKEETDDKQND